MQTSDAVGFGSFFIDEEYGFVYNLNVGLARFATCFAEDFKMTESMEKQNTGRKIGFGLLGGCGLAVLVFVVVTICTAVAFPFWVVLSGSSYMESQFAMNFILPPICGALVALVTAIAGFVMIFRRAK